ncbi:hypothetical protein SeMB42_g07644 [Synchytrium endobioticum]|uniref:Uncharacterized protein n=1 Tax=Synchytrium endobioticum TaxID=286115 RepID=A0A507BYH4_9FUNG|nr:hypothetical protein SeMB42_g07644 [Synchytrium endobioticum]
MWSLAKGANDADGRIIAAATFVTEWKFVFKMHRSYKLLILGGHHPSVSHDPTLEPHYSNGDIKELKRKMTRRAASAACVRPSRRRHTYDD